MYASVALLSPPYACLTYALPPEFPAAFWQTGLRLAVPLGRGEQGALRAAVLLRVSPTTDLPENVACKTVCWPLENEALLPPDLLALALDLARRQGVEPGHILGHVLPQGLRSTRVRLHRLEAGRASALSLRQIREIQPEKRRELAQALCVGAARMLAPGADAASEEFCLLRADPPWPVRPSAARQIEVLEYLHEHGAVSRRRLLQNLGQAVAPALQSLLKAGHLALTREDSGEEDEQALLPPPPTPFCLNADQEAALAGLRAALGEEEPAPRLLYGVTGSGKTAVAMGAMLLCAEAGWQAALMAPTELLARQHYEGMRPFFEAQGYSCGLLVGGMPAARRREALESIASGAWRVVVGTHALISRDVAYYRLGLCVTDEQHRFGVAQRTALLNKGGDGTHAPHLLVMSATPIPRSLALVLYGDLDLSVIDEMPPGRLPVNTRIVSESKREAMYGFLRDQLAAGRQAYIVCPLVEEDDEAGLSHLFFNSFRIQRLLLRFLNFLTGTFHGNIAIRYC